MTFRLRIEDYEVDPERGFLPPLDPLERLPPELAAWERVAADVQALQLTGRLRSEVRNLDIPDLESLTERRVLERAMLLLSVVGGAYVWGSDTPVSSLPRALALPWASVATRLGRPPIVAHASIVLSNWRRLEPAGPITLDNLGTLQTFGGSLDEQWFYLITVAMEARGAEVIRSIVCAHEAVDAGDDERLEDALAPIAPGIAELTAILSRTSEHCDPYVFYHRVRPYLAGWPEPGLTYEGVRDGPIRLAGGSAAQSSLFQAIDAGLGVSHEDERTRPFLQAMRGHMPPAHRAFLQALESGPSLRDRVAAGRPGSIAHYDEAVRELDRFRKTHFEIAVRYITRQAQTPTSARGTGGTEIASFLSTARDETTARLIDPGPARSR